MVWNLAALSKNTEVYNPFYSYISVPYINTAYENPWAKYFASNAEENSKVTAVKQVNTYDAMAQLNAMQEAEKSGKTTSVEEGKDADKKAKAQKKLAKLSKALQKNDSFKLTQKHIDALNMLKNNPDLAGLNKMAKEKIDSVSNQNAFLLSKVMLTQNQQDLTADNILSVVNDVKQMFTQLQKDWQKIASSLIKAGAYSEAMMKVDNSDKKEKYKSKAYELVLSMPDAFRNKAEAQAVEQELEELEAQETENDGEISENDNDLEGNCPEVNVEQSSESNPFAIADENKTPQVEETDAAEYDLEEDDDAVDDTAELSQAPAEEKDDELEDLKKEVKKELKKQKQGNKTNTNFVELYNKAKVESLNSVLFS